MQTFSAVLLNVLRKLPDSKAQEVVKEIAVFRHTGLSHAQRRLKYVLMRLMR